MLVADITISVYESEINDRFQNSDTPDTFLLSAFDLSGLGRSSNDRWATLIGPNTILSANHFQPTGSVTFYPDNDPASTPVVVGISSDAVRVNGTDLWIARLEEAPPVSITPFAYATAPMIAGNPFPYLGQAVYMVGVSPGSFSAEQDQAFGTNIVSHAFVNDTTAGLGVYDSLLLTNDPGQTPHEAFLQVGDSGAPLLYDDGSVSLLVLGINSYINGPLVVDSHSAVNYIGNESDAIDAQVAEWAAAIPEPKAVLPVGWAALAWVILRKRLYIFRKAA